MSSAEPEPVAPVSKRELIGDLGRMGASVLKYGLLIFVPATVLALIIHPLVAGGLVSIAAGAFAVEPAAVRPVISPLAFVLVELGTVLAVVNVISE
jgi:hypothetical protein